MTLSHGRTLLGVLLLWPGVIGTAHAGQPPIRFSFTYPAQAQAHAHAQLWRWLRREEALMRDAGTAEALAGRREAASSGHPFHPYETVRRWKVITETPRFLSLSVERYDYTGGAHGNTSYASLLWDKIAKERRTSLSLFDPHALRAAVMPAFCRQLDAQRRHKRDGTLGGMAEFNRCIDPIKQAVLLGSSTGSRFNRIGFVVPPYQAGSYTEGMYEVTLPVTATVLKVVKPRWRSYFAVMSPGKR